MRGGKARQEQARQDGGVVSFNAAEAVWRAQDGSRRCDGQGEGCVPPRRVGGGKWAWQRLQRGLAAAPHHSCLP